MRAIPCGSAVLAAVVAALVVACGSGEGSGTTPLDELERLAFVPASQCRLDGFVGEDADLSLRRAIVFDLYELSRGRRAELLRARGIPVERVIEFESAAQDEDADLPAYLTREEAVALARMRGMRLPTAKEWLHVAVGRRSFPYPWGQEHRGSVANTLELEFNKPCAVGTFERGRSEPFGCYDMLGNVWEWVDGHVPGYDDDGAAVGDTALGGSWRHLPRKTYGAFDTAGREGLYFHAMTVAPGTSAPFLGARMCADAETYLLETADQWGSDARSIQRIEGVGRRWAGAVGTGPILAVLEPLLARPAAPRALASLAAGARGAL